MASTTFAPLPVSSADTGLPDDHERLGTVTATQEGGYALIWSGIKGAGDTAVHQFYMQRFDAAGQRVGPEVTLATPAPGASATALPDGSVLMAWTASQPLTAADPSIVRTGVYTQRLDGTGAASGPVTEVHALVQDMRAIEQVKFILGHQVLLLEDGSYVVGWHHTTGPMTRWATADGQAQRFEASGARRGGILDLGHSETASVSLIPGADGDTFIAALMAAGGPAATLRYVRFDGATATPIPADIDGTVPAGSSLVPLEDGRYLLWQAPHLSTPEPLTRFLGPDGLPVGPALDGVAMPGTVVALEDGGFLTLKSGAQPGIAAQRYDAQGNPNGTSLDIAPHNAFGWSFVTERLPDGSLALAMQITSHALRASDVMTRVLDEIGPAPAPAPEGTGGGSSSSGSAGPGRLLMGTPGADTLFGTSGPDVFQGGTGLDVALFSGTMSSYTVTRGPQGVTVSGPEGTDVLVDVERMRFGDQSLAMDVQGNAGMAYRLYQAAFDRRPDLAGLGYQMNALDQGLDISQVAQNFIASPEFQSRYGNVDDGAFIRLLYANVLDRAPDAQGFVFHTGNLAAGTHTRANVLVGFSESPENQAAVIGVIQNGMAYIG